MPSSRITKRQQKKLLKQTVFYIVAAISIAVLFLFVVMPQAVKFAAVLFDGESVFEPTDTIPPQVPVISAPVSATNSALLPISGVGEAESKVVFVLNGEELQRADISEEGEFSLDVPLDEGQNQLALYSIDAAENESVQTKTYQIILDTQNPPIEIESPEQDATIQLRKNQLTNITGTTEPNAKVYVQDRLVYANSEGNFSTTYLLSEGDNTISIKAIDQAGNESETELRVRFEF